LPRFLEDPRRLWSLWQQSKQFHVPPSELLGVADSYVAWTLNNAVHHFGSTLEAELNSVKDDKTADQKRKFIFTRWMSATGNTKGCIGIQQLKLRRGRKARELQPRHR
jgi:hypothetical protein